jgi:hypothetical protein
MPKCEVILERALRSGVVTVSPRKDPVSLRFKRRDGALGSKTSDSNGPDVARVVGIDYTRLEMIVYDGSIEDSHSVIQFLRHEADKLRALRRIIISPEKTVIKDLNKDTMEFPGLTYGSPVLEELLRELGVVFTAEILHDPDATSNGIKEYEVIARWTWGHDRVM